VRGEAVDVESEPNQVDAASLRFSTDGKIITGAIDNPRHKLPSSKNALEPFPIEQEEPEEEEPGQEP